MKRIDLTGAKFVRITVLAPDDSRISASGRTETMWRCVCDCGKELSASTAILRSGHKQSCGCFSIEAKKERSTTHGFYGTKTYVSWRSMINRCTNSKLAIYANYGGRGISVCARWMSFDNFLEDMGERPAGTSIDRIDNDGNYEPGNCRWAKARQQCENRRSTRWIEHNGIRLSISEWARRLGIDKSTLIESINKYPIDHALRQRKTPDAQASFHGESNA